VKRGRRQGESPGLAKCLAVNRRMFLLGARYRHDVPKKRRSYQRWISFLRKHAPDLVAGTVKGVAARGAR